MFSISDVVAWTHKMAAASGILPTYQRYINGVPIPNTRRILRFREKYIVLLVFAIFVTVCFGGFFFLPELRDRVKVDTLTKGARHIFMPEPLGGSGPQGGHHHHHNHNPKDHKGVEKSTLKNGDKSLNLIDLGKRLNISKEAAQGLQKLIKDDKSKRQVVELKKKEEIDRKARENVAINHMGRGVQGGEPLQDPITKIRRDKVKEVSDHLRFFWQQSCDKVADSLANCRNRSCPLLGMMKFAWDSYTKYAWGGNELRPISKRAHNSGIFGPLSLGASIIDGIDTLYIMGLNEEYKTARDWVATSFSFDGATEVSVFEANIRFLGGLLSAYALTGDQMFKDKAISVGNKLLPAFNTATGVPQSMINLKTGSTRNWGWASGGCSILAEFGSIHLEFIYLANISGNPVFEQKVMKIRETLRQLERPQGLYPIYLNPRTGKWGQHHFSVGAMGDSFYEYLLKVWIYTGKKDSIARQMYDEAITNIESKLLQTSHGGLKYLADYKSGRIDHKMDHLACFAGGMFALGANGSSDPAKYTQLGEAIATTCHASYDRSFTKLGPEAFRFEGQTEAKAMRQNEKYYILRPEVVETYFYMWRFTKNKKYREWGWEVVLALEKYCRTEGGFTGIKDVYSQTPAQDDVQQSFFLAETLKYLYLLFSDDSLLPLDSWVFNTEAHPFPIQNSNALKPIS